MQHNGEMIIYRTQDGLADIQLRAVDGTVWLTQAEIAELFDTTPQNVTQHIKTLYEDGELEANATCKTFLQVQEEGGRTVERKLKHYNLNVILAVGYRVRSPRGTQFRQWATTTLREYLVKGFVINDEKMKDPTGWDYFDELLERIREIRASEKRFYQQVCDVYATAVDYERSSDSATLFFKTVQNKMLYAVTGHTAAELVAMRADAEKPNMGLQSWKGERVRKGDVVTAKNYLNEKEIKELSRIVTMYLDFAEDMAQRRKQMTMADWAKKLDDFLEFNERQVLTGAGKVSHKNAEKIAHREYESFDLNRKQTEKELADNEALEELRQIETEAAQLRKNREKKDEAS